MVPIIKYGSDYLVEKYAKPTILGDKRFALAISEPYAGRLAAVGETVILLHPPLPSVGVSIRINRGCHQNASLADGYWRPRPSMACVACMARLTAPADGLR